MLATAAAVGRVKLEAGQDGGGAVDEQAHGRVGGGDLRLVVLTWRGQRRDDVQGLAGDLQRLAAGDEDLDLGAVGEQPGREAGGGVDDVLAVVQDQHRVPVGERRGEPVNRVARHFRAARCDGPLAEPERVEDRVGDLGRVGDRSEFREPGGDGDPAGDLRREPRLADAARAGERDQALGPQPLEHVGHVVVPADEACRRAAHPGGARAARLAVPLRFRLAGGGRGLRRRGGLRDLLAEDRQVGLL